MKTRAKTRVGQFENIRRKAKKAKTTRQLQKRVATLLIVLKLRADTRIAKFENIRKKVKQATVTFQLQKRATTLIHQMKHTEYKTLENRQNKGRESRFNRQKSSNMPQNGRIRHYETNSLGKLKNSLNNHSVTS